MRIPRWAWALPIVFANCICSNKLGGDLTLNGEPFAPSSCRNGAVYGFSGVEVTGKGGWKLRLVQTPTGEANVVVFGPDSPRGAELGACGTVKVDTQNSTVNDVKNVEGSAVLACAADGVSLSGKVTFENCH
ncbi:MAG: hypothetical protein IPL61_31185 [Myxococcales bacterium]|nr:hypothetical protein [Myxococcales bacterium]